MTDSLSNLADGDDNVDDQELIEFLEQVKQVVISGRDTAELEEIARNQFGDDVVSSVDAIKFLARLKNVASSADDRIEAPTVSISAKADGITFGRFRIVERLGMGGYGVVFRVFDPELAREAALKIPRGDMLWDSNREIRFRREARTAAKLTHPNIVPVYEAGSNGSIYYILSAYCPGPSLAKWLHEEKSRSRRISAQKAARWMALLADATDYAHSMGVMHRDLKPGNILLDPNQRGETTPNSDDDFIPKITDFGLAKFVMEESPLTRSGTIMGTLAYMAPELLAGLGQPVKATADIYSLGAILYEMLCCRPPITGTDEIDLLRRIGIEDPPSIRSINADVPRELENICLKCLDRNPSLRYSTALELKQDLQRFLENKAIIARPIGKVRSWYRRIARSRFPVWLLAINILALVPLAIWMVHRQLNAKSDNTNVVRIDTSHPDPKHADKFVENTRKQMERAYVLDMKRAYRIWSESSNLDRDNSNTSADMKELLIRHVPMEGGNDYRGFEWYYCWRLCEPDRFNTSFEKMRHFVAHSGCVYQTRFLRTRPGLVTAGADKIVRLWKLNEETETMSLVGHTDEVNSFAMSGDENWIATASDDRSVRIWNCDSGEQFAQLTGHQDHVVSIAFEEDGRRVFTGDNSGILKVWDVATKSEVLSYQGHSERIQSLVNYDLSIFGRSFVGPHDTFVSCSADGYARKWRFGETGRFTLSQDWTIHIESNLEDCKHGHFSNLLLMLSRHPTNYISESIVCRPDKPYRCVFTTRDQLRASSFLASGSQVMCGGSKQPLTEIDISTGKYWTVTKQPLDLWSMDVSPNGIQIATGEADGTVTLWNRQAWSPYIVIPSSCAKVRSPLLELSPNGRWLISRNISSIDPSKYGETKIVCWDLEGQNPVPTELLSESQADLSHNLLTRFSADGKFLVIAKEKSGGEEYGFRSFKYEGSQWNLQHDSMISRLIDDFSVNADGRIQIVSRLLDQAAIETYDLKTGKAVNKISLSKIEDLRRYEVHFSTGGDQVVIRDSSKLTFCQFDLRRNALDMTKSFSVPLWFKGEVTRLAISSDGQMLAIGSHVGEVSIVQCENGEEIIGKTLSSRMPIDGLAFLGGDRIIVWQSWSGEPSIQLLWKNSLEAICPLPLPKNIVVGTRLFASAKGNAIAFCYQWSRKDSTQIGDRVNGSSIVVWHLTGEEPPPVAQQDFNFESR